MVSCIHMAKAIMVRRYTSMVASANRRGASCANYLVQRSSSGRSEDVFMGGSYDRARRAQPTPANLVTYW